MAEAMLPHPKRGCEECDSTGWRPYYREALNGDFERAYELCGCGLDSMCQAMSDLLVACEWAYGWFQDFEEHAPDEWVFGGEEKVKRLLSKAIQKAKGVASGGAIGDKLLVDADFEAAPIGEENPHV